MVSIRSLALRAVQLPGFTAPFTLLMRKRATIFMLHRFRSAELGIDGHDPELLRKLLAHLRKGQYSLLSLERLFRSLSGEEQLPERSVAFTIDDGYLDHALVGAPIFAEFDCPVTTFVTTGFLDGQLWFWWDRIQHVFDGTRRDRVEFEVGGRPVRYQWTDGSGRARATADFTELCKRLPDVDKHAAIESLAGAAEVELPLSAPPRYAPMNWDQLRRCEVGGMGFGPHTVTHPVLSRTDDGQSEREIVASWKRLCEEAHSPVPVFCYPNGQPNDYGEREFGFLERIGMLGAVIGTPGYASIPSFGGTADARFQVPRYGYTESLPHLLQYVSGMEQAKEMLRGGFRRAS